jgi:alanine-glyoxylate transaminase / serine-glyoxylate transaminase / serine-pyruvate transaminase
MSFMAVSLLVRPTEQRMGADDDVNRARSEIFTNRIDVFARHQRHGEATRRAVRAWGLEVFCREPRHYSGSLTAVLMPEGHSADDFRRIVAETFDMSLGNGLSKIADKVFRIGHLGDFNDLMLSGTLAGVEMGLELAGVPYMKGGVQAATDYLAAEAAHAGKGRAAAA